MAWLGLAQQRSIQLQRLHLPGQLQRHAAPVLQRTRRCKRPTLQERRPAMAAHLDGLLQQLLADSLAAAVRQVGRSPLPGAELGRPPVGVVGGEQELAQQVDPGVAGDVAGGLATPRLEEGRGRGTTRDRM
jgi:hypothetical protein